MRLVLGILATVFSLSAEVIEGTVVDSVTGTALAGVLVTIKSRGQPAYHSTTDSGGVFRFEDVKAGIYTAEFSKENYLITENDGAVLRPFSIPTASGVLRLEARLAPFGKIMGRVLDASGDPVAGAELQLNGSRLGLTGVADSQGKFSFQAAPGHYVLLAKAPPALPPPHSENTERLGWVDTYYPGVADSRAAADILLRAGGELWGQDIRLKAAGMRRVHGIVLDTAGNPVPNAKVRAARTDETLLRDLQCLSSEDGAFEFPSLYDGEWIISARQETDGVRFLATAGLQVSDRELDPVVLRLNPPFTVRGTVSVPGAAEFPERIGVFLRPALIAGSQDISRGSANSDGSFRIDDVYPGSYKIIASSPGLPIFLASIRMGGRDILGQHVTLDPNSPPIEIGFESRGGGVRGKLQDCGGAVIALAPQETLLRDPQFVRTAKCGDGDSFEISGLRPGDYYAFAFDPWPGPLELLVRLDRDLVNKAVSVHVNRSETAVIELGLTIRDR